jgi:hypothetical protein
MHLIKLPSVYDLKNDKTHNPEKRRTRLLQLLAGGLIVCGALALVFKSEAIYCGLLALFWLTTVGMIALVTAGRPISQGESGEAEALASLQELPGDFTAITNCKIPGYEQIGDLDIVVIGPPGIVIIEVKSIHVPLLVDGDTWIFPGRMRGGGFTGTGPRFMPSVSVQLDNQVKALAQSLKRIGIVAKIDGIIGLNPTANIEIVNPPAYPVVIYELLSQHLLKLTDASTKSALSSVQIERIITHLAGVQAAEPEPKYYQS